MALFSVKNPNIFFLVFTKSVNNVSARPELCYGARNSPNKVISSIEIPRKTSTIYKITMTYPHNERKICFKRAFHSRSS